MTYIRDGTRVEQCPPAAQIPDSKEGVTCADTQADIVRAVRERKVNEQFFCSPPTDDWAIL